MRMAIDQRWGDERAAQIVLLPIRKFLRQVRRRADLGNQAVLHGERGIADQPVRFIGSDHGRRREPAIDLA